MNERQVTPIDKETLPISESGLATRAEREQTVCDVKTVELAMQGDKEAFAALFRASYRQMYFVARRILWNDEDIYDALQIGYTKAYKYLARLSAPEAFYAWLAQTVENAAKDVLREVHSAESVDMDADAVYEQQDAVGDRERKLDVDRALEQLDPALVEVLTLFYYDGLKLKEIAPLLGISVHAVQRRFSKAKKALREVLQERGIDGSMYSGGFGTMIAVSLRSLIGTDLLSAAKAQKMLDEIFSGKAGASAKAAHDLIKQQRDRAILKTVSLLMLMCAAVSLAVVLLVLGLGNHGRPTEAQLSVTTTTVTQDNTAPTNVEAYIKDGVYIEV